MACLSFDETKNILLGQYQIFEGHENLRFLKLAKKAYMQRTIRGKTITIDGVDHFFTNQVLYQFVEGRSLSLTLFNYLHMPNWENSPENTFKWVYVKTPIALSLIKQRGVVAIFENGFNLFGFHMQSSADNPEEAFLANPLIQHYVQSL